MADEYIYTRVYSDTGGESRWEKEKLDFSVLEKGEADAYRRIGQLSETAKNIEEKLDKKSGVIQRDFNNAIKQSEKNLNEKIDSSKLGVIETLGIFVALFTFISVNINIFSKTKDLFTASVFMILMAITIIFFMSPLLLLIQKNETNNKTQSLKLIFLGSLFLLFAILVVTKYFNMPLNFN